MNDTNKDCVFDCDLIQSNNFWPTYGVGILIGGLALCIIISLTIYFVTERRYKRRRLIETASQTSTETIDESRRLSEIKIIKNRNSFIQLITRVGCSSEFKTYYASGPPSRNSSSSNIVRTTSDRNRLTSPSSIASIQSIDEANPIDQDKNRQSNLQHI